MSTVYREIFNHVCNEVLAQGEPARTKTGRCALRSPDGQRCALGVLVPDEVYAPFLEDASVSVVAKYYARWKGEPLSELSRVLALYLQRAHDDAARSRQDFTAAFKAKAYAGWRAFCTNWCVKEEDKNV